MTNLEFNIKNELKNIEHFHKVENPTSVVSDKRDADIRKDMSMIATDARRFGISKRDEKAEISKWTNSDIKNMTDFYKNKGLAAGTIINYVSSLRSFLKETGRTNIDISNKTLGLVRIIDYSNKSFSAKYPALNLTDKLSHFKGKDVNVYTQLKLAKIAGLRREESVHAALALAKRYDILKDNKLILKGSWCKNGRPREIKLSLEKVKEIKELQNFAVHNDYNKSRNLEREKKHLSNSVYRNGFNIHSLRHEAAQERYAEFVLSGYTEKTSESAVSQFLGHGPDRQDVTNIYLGKG